MRRPVLAALAAVVLLAPSLGARAGARRRRLSPPPQVIVDILDAPPPPDVYLSPARDVVAVLERAPMPSIAELARPMLRLAGLRIDPGNNGRHRARTAQRALAQDGGRRRHPRGDAAGRTRAHVAGVLGRRRRASPSRTPATPAIDLWIGESASGRAQRGERPGAERASSRSPCTWVGAGGQLLCSAIPPGRGAAPAAPAGADGPERAGASRRRRAGAHLSGPADVGPRRGALRVSRHEPARVRERRQRRAHADRASRALLAGPALARRPVRARHHARRAVLAARALRRLRARRWPSGIGAAP